MHRDRSILCLLIRVHQSQTDPEGWMPKSQAKPGTRARPRQSSEEFPQQKHHGEREGNTSIGPERCCHTKTYPNLWDHCWNRGHSQLDTKTAQLLIHRWPNPQGDIFNLISGIYKAVTNLREDENIVILPANEGNATVVLDQAGWLCSQHGKLLEDSAYMY